MRAMTFVSFKEFWGGPCATVVPLPLISDARIFSILALGSRTGVIGKGVRRMLRITVLASLSHFAFQFPLI